MYRTYYGTAVICLGRQGGRARRRKASEAVGSRAGRSQILLHDKTTGMEERIIMIEILSWILVIANMLFKICVSIEISFACIRYQED